MGLGYDVLWVGLLWRGGLLLNVIVRFDVSLGQEACGYGWPVFFEFVGVCGSVALDYGLLAGGWLELPFRR